MRQIFLKFGVLFLTICPSLAEAETISITTVSKLTIETVKSETGNSYRMSGTLTLTNSGDETASNVAPSMIFEDWHWEGRARNIKPGQSDVWQVNSILLYEDLICKKECSNLSLPARGVLPVRLKIAYRDLAGYSFSTLSVTRLPFDLQSGMNSSLASSSNLNFEIEIDGNGQDFDVQVVGITNNVEELALSAFASEEFEISPSWQLVKSAKGEFQANTKISNLKALLGSRYPVSVVAQWREGDFQTTRVVTGVVEIEQLSRLRAYLLGAGAFVIFGGFLGWFVFFREGISS